MLVDAQEPEDVSAPTDAQVTEPAQELVDAQELAPSRVTCTTCPHACSLAEGAVGFCRARTAHDGQVAPQSYGRITSLALDPIEKKPIARWHPGSTVLSLGSYGCTMRCPFCQNASIAQVGADEVRWTLMQPEEIVQQAQSLANRRCIGIAYTYNEPLAAWEFVRDTAELAHEAGLLNVLVSNGMAAEEPRATLASLIDAANIDLKCFTEDGYRFLGGELGAVKRTIERLAQAETCHLEVTTLVVPGFNDTAEEIAAMTTWLASIDPAIPYHLTRFFPHYKMADTAPTPLATMLALRDVACRSMNDVLLGNV